jgi:SAM-dependent methyltransferase
MAAARRGETYEQWQSRRAGEPGGEWEPDAEAWVAWARAPGHDAYWYYRDAFFDGVVPPAGRRTLEIGCGEGRVARDLAVRGHGVVALDTSQTLLRHARQEDATGSYVLADGGTLPFPDRCFDIAVAYNSLQVVADMTRTVSEAARVLDRGGRFCVCVAHPLTDLGHFSSDDDDARLLMRPAYFENERVEDTVTRNGFKMTFRGWTYSLEDYSLALEAAGFRIELLREPRPIESDRYRRWRRVPMFLQLRAVKS